MQLYSINTGLFKLDGGAMFGVVPKTLWNKLESADENNLCTWSMRCLLVQQGNQLILIDNGIGDKQDAKFMGHYYLHGNDTLDSSLNALGFHRSDITHVLLTHLHFDHCGGSIVYNTVKERYESAFPNATFIINEEHWHWAVNPNAREKASFLKENILPIQESGQLQLIQKPEIILPNIAAEYVYGHTEGMILPKISYKNHTLLFMADLTPSVSHLPLPFIMAYDMRPLQTLNEKQQMLQKACDEKWILFFEHDAKNECCTLKQTEKGPRVDEIFPLSSIA